MSTTNLGTEAQKSTKVIQMELSEFNHDLLISRVEGMNFIVNLVRDIVRNQGVNIKLTDNADPQLLDFLDEVKSKCWPIDVKEVK